MNEAVVCLFAGELRAISYVLSFSDYISHVTGDDEFPSAIVDIISDYLFYKSKSLEDYKEIK